MPYISKVTGIPIVPLATRVICGHTIKDLGYKPGLQPEADYIAVKDARYSPLKRSAVQTSSLGPEYEVYRRVSGIAKTFNEALYKAFAGSGIKIPKHKNMIITVKDSDKEEIIDIARRFKDQGYKIFSTAGTAKVSK